MEDLYSKYEGLSNYYQQNNIDPSTLHPYLQEFVDITNPTPNTNIIENLSVAKTPEITSANSLISKWVKPQSETEQPTTSSYTPMSGTTAQKAKKVIDYFTGMGFTRAQAAGIAGNAFVESGFNTGSVGDTHLKTASEGMFQHREKRLTNLKNFAKSKGKDYRDFDVQLAFVNHELNTDYKGVLSVLKKTTTPEQAADVFGRKFEVPQIKSEQQKEHFKKRLNMASKFYKEV